MTVLSGIAKMYKTGWKCMYRACKCYNRKRFESDWLQQLRHSLRLRLSTTLLAFTVRVYSSDEIVRSRHI
jgi:hypothetical protein